jgi:hypothetical protein
MAEIDIQFRSPSIGNSRPVKAATKIEKGHAVGCEAATGYFRPLVSGDLFAGLALETVDNTDGADGDIHIVTPSSCLAEVDVVGSDITEFGSTVYATSSSVYNVAGTSVVGSIVQFISGTKCLVKFKSAGE